MQNNQQQNTGSPIKRMGMDLIKILLFLIVCSALFHNKLAALVDSISDFAFHHIFLSALVVLFLLAITIEFDFYEGSHAKQLKSKLTKKNK